MTTNHTNGQESLREAAASLLDALPKCRCDVAYTCRELLDPDCRYHDYDQEASALKSALTTEAAELRGKLEAAEQSEEAVQIKLQTLLAGGHGETCGCSYDRPNDICMHHSPALVAATNETAELRAEVGRLRGAVELCNRYFTGCAKAWLANEGRLVNDNGNAYVQSEGLDDLANQAGEAVVAALAPTPSVRETEEPRS